MSCLPAGIGRRSDRDFFASSGRRLPRARAPGTGPRSTLPATMLLLLLLLGGATGTGKGARLRPRARARARRRDLAAGMWAETASAPHGAAQAGVTLAPRNTDGRSQGTQARRTRACVRVQLIMPRALDDLRCWTTTPRFQFFYYYYLSIFVKKYYVPTRKSVLLIK